MLALAALILAGGGLGAAADPVGAAFPGADGLIAFASDRDGDTEIYTITAKGELGKAGKPAKQLTRNRAFDDPAWSPNGRRIAFTSDRDGDREIFVMDADGSGQTNRTNNGAIDFSPAWSPDGSQIAFVRFSGDNF